MDDSTSKSMSRSVSASPRKERLGSASPARRSQMPFTRPAVLPAASAAIFCSAVRARRRALR
eukprot:1648551-Pyramimonas_sp.AAC.1